MKHTKIILITGVLTLSFANLFAQKDTSKSQSVNITSAYKPEIKEPSKINFSGSQLTPDITRETLQYNIPKQNLYYSYAPIPLRPLALAMDTSIALGDRYYVKAGFGNLSTPYLKAGAGFGDGKTNLVNVTGEYHSSKGKDIQYQDYSMIGLQLAGSYFLPKNEVSGILHFQKNDWYKYGYDHALFPNINKNDIKQNLQDVGLKMAFKNTAINSLNINYQPSLEVGNFSNKNFASELYAKVNVPVEKVFEGGVSAKVDFTADISRFKSQDILPLNYTINNNLVYVTPSINYNSKEIKFSGGVTPSWNNGKFNLLPAITGEVQLADQVFSLQAGWIGRFVKNSYRNLINVNPYLVPSATQLNTKETEYYGGIKASLANHFTVNAKAGLVKYEDLPLFINDTASAKQNNFLIVNESKIKNFRVQGDISYINQEKFSLTGGLTLNAYTGLKDNQHAWGTLPMEFKGALRWKPIKDLQLKSDLYLFGNSKYVTKSNDTKTTNGGTDLSAGMEYKIKKNLSIWFDANNLLNDKYERWHNYKVYGINFVGGLLIHL